MFIKTQMGDIINTDRIQKIITKRNSKGKYQLIAIFGRDNYSVLGEFDEFRKCVFYQARIGIKLGVIDPDELCEYKEEQA